jgi:hypothetical protein
MNDQLDQRVAEWLAAGPSWETEPGLGRALSALRRVSQRPAWIAELTDATLPRSRSTWLAGPARVALLALVLLALIGMTVAANLGRLRQTSPFESERYGYSIHLLPGWRAVSAEVAWGPGLTIDQDKAWDVLFGPDDARLLIVSAKVSDGTVTRVWADAQLGRYLETRGSGADRRCVHSTGIGTPLAPDAERFMFHEGATLDGHDALARAACGYTEAVAAAGGRMYVAVLDRAAATADDWALFDALTASLDLHPEKVANVPPTARPSSPPPPAPTPSRAAAQRFTFESRLYHYTIELIGSLAAVMPATQPWAATGRWDGLRSDFVDKLGPHVSVISSVPAGSMSAEDWARAFVPPRVVGTRCKQQGNMFMMEAPKSTWKEADYNGHPGVKRERCGYVDGVVIVNGRAYLFSLRGPFNPTVDSAARAEFLAMMSTVEFKD